MELSRLFLYNDWANREEIARLGQITIGRGTALRLLGHIIAAEWLWLARLGWNAKQLEVWPDLTLERCSQDVDWLLDAWKVLLRDADRTAMVEYRNSKGETWTSRVDDIFMHVVLHGAYHRGQIATVMRQGGEEPPYTDFIHATRAGLLPE
jgi:uncharacterized damage-inducible protein DinB